MRNILTHRFNRALLLLLLLGNVGQLVLAQGITIAKVKYEGGGDWYANKTALPNLIDFCNSNLNTNLSPGRRGSRCR